MGRDDGTLSRKEYERELAQLHLELVLVRDGIILRKYWFSVSDAEQERRFASRSKDPLRRWKLSRTRSTPTASAARA